MKCDSYVRASLLVVIGFAGSTLIAEESTVKVSVKPPEAQVFIDGKSWSPGPTTTIKTTPGPHSLTITNYGFVSQTRQVTLNAGRNPSLEFTLERRGDNVSGPWGRIQIENAPGKAAVLLNGTTADYFVGHVDMFNNHNIWRQELVVPAGKHHLTILTRDGEFWSGELNVPANQRVILHAASNKTVVKQWPDGATAHASLPRFSAGIASATVAVAPVVASHRVEPARINCGETTRLTWSTQDAVETSITANSANLGDVPVSGERTEKPRQTTTYEFQTSGPGGVVNSTATTEVNTAVQADLAASPAEVRYHRMGDKVVEHTAANLNWSSANADSASLDPIGTVNTIGDQTVQPTPQQGSNGLVDENVTYTFTARNMCGGSETRTATVHITGTIEPVPEVPLASVFFPTGYPEEKRPQIGLVRSQHSVLAKTAEGMKKYLIYDPNARITLTAHADVRGPTKMNQSLSERRANGVRTYLVKQGVPQEKIDIVAMGEGHDLTRSEVMKLHDQNPNKADFTKRNPQALVWAYNRRVDVTLLPAGQKSTQFFPGNADDAKLLFRSEWQGRRSIEKAGEETVSEPAVGQLRNVPAVAAARAPRQKQ